MGKWREDCPDCYDDNCLFCDKFISGMKYRPLQRTPWQRFIAFLKSFKI